MQSPSESETPVDAQKDEGLSKHLQSLKSAFSTKGMPCSAGTFAVKPKDLILYYGKEDPENAARRVDFMKASDDVLRRLAGYCEPASFGRGNEAVLDESYRRAGKLDLENFACQFSPEQSGLLAQIQDLLLEGHKGAAGIRAELYKLNVYGPGQFFKKHKDTPRGDDMFASLVVVFPTRHEGGALAFRHEEQTFRFESDKAMAGASSSPSIAYAAFFSDLDHEVETVQSGYRVTLTYNLYYATPSAMYMAPSIGSAYETKLRAAFQALLDDKTLFPTGGFLGFCLRHQYTGAALKDKRLLKGSDAVLAKVVEDLKLDGSVRVIYYADAYCDEEDDILPLYDPREYHEGDAGIVIMCNKLVTIPSIHEHSPSLTEYLMDECGGLLLESADVDDTKRERDIEVKWVTEVHTEGLDMVKQTYAIDYGNEPVGLSSCYGSLCFIVEVTRGTASKLASLSLKRKRRSSTSDSE